MKRLFIWLDRIIKQHKALKRWKQIITVLAAIMTFATTYALILPAITVEKSRAEDVAGMYLEQEEQDDMLVENALEPPAGDILAGNSDEDVGVDETDAEIPDYDDALENETLDGSADPDEVDSQAAANTLGISGSDYTVTLFYDATSGIPEEADLNVTEIPQDSKEYQTYLAETKKAMGLKEEESLPRFAARFFDIKIMVGDEEFIPESDVSVEITYEEPLAEKADAEVNAVHFADETAEAEVIEANTTEVQDGGAATVEFTAESFSVYGVIYTVDFHWEVNGKTYDFSLPGGGFVRLTDIVQMLGIGVSNMDVENVEFSNPELVWVGKVEEDAEVGWLKEANGLEIEYSAELTEEQIAEINAQTVEAGDWALISMRAFDTEETLTITMKNGEQFAVIVTDANAHLITDTSNIEDGRYVIMMHDTTVNRWYAINSNGDKQEIVYNQQLAANVPDSCLWDIVDWGSAYTITQGMYPNFNYLDPTTGNLTNNHTALVDIYPADSNRKVTIKGYGSELHLSWSSDTRDFVSHEHAQTFYLAQVGDVEPRELTKYDGRPYSAEDLYAWYEQLSGEGLPEIRDYAKTAEVSDYDNRIYKVDITAKSGIQTLCSDVDVGFVVDVSNSMKFPSDLEAIKFSEIPGLTNSTIHENKWGEEAIELTQDVFSKLRAVYPDEDFYVISDPTGTSTNYRVTYRNREYEFRDASSSKDSEYKPIGDPQGLIRSADANNDDIYIDGHYYYPVYRDVQPTMRRLDYLKEGLANAMDALLLLSSKDEVSASVSFSTFCKTVVRSAFSNNGTPNNFAQITNGSVENIKNQITGQIFQNTDGGTSHDLAMEDAKVTTDWQNRQNGGFRWDDSSRRYLIVITDGASVNNSARPSGKPTTPEGISTAANTAATSIKTQDGVTIITIGLSMEHIEAGSELLHNMSSSLQSGNANPDDPYKKLFWNAEKGSDLTPIFYDIMQTIMADATAYGNVTDVIDDAFVPVDNETKLPLDRSRTYKIKADGTITQNAAESVGTIAYTNNQWVVTWDSQTFEWDTPWHGSVYVKAKEDFLGGNTIDTNKSASIKVTGFTATDNLDPSITPARSRTVEIPANNQKTYAMPDPIVNVKELELTGHDATWTLYLGAEVTDDEVKKQISNLFDAIQVNEIVKEDGTPVTSDADTPVTFLLKTLVGGDLTGPELTKLLNEEPVVRNYSHYGHEDIGTVTLNLVKSTNDDGDTVYTLTASYDAEDPHVTDPETGLPVSWHNGPNGPGREMRTITSNNTQTMEEYYLPESFEAKKVDENGEVITTSPALFKLYRKAKEGENGVSLTSYDENLTDLYALIDTVHTGADGIAHIGGLLDDQGNPKDESLLMNASDGPYYLIETGAPMGYTRTRTPTVITVTAGPNFYYDLDGNLLTVPEGTLPSVPYNMKQGVTITISGEAATEAIMVDADGNETTLIDGEGNVREYLLETDTATTWQTSITNNKIPDDGGVDQEQMLPHSKKIDYLGDGQDNPDTTADNNVQANSDNANAVNDLYRLYLDATMYKSAINANIILVEDYSSSMDNNYIGDVSRYEVMRNVLKGDNGFIKTVLAEGSGNEMTVIKFSDIRMHDLRGGGQDQGTEILVPWTDSADTVLSEVDKAYPNVYTSDDGYPYRYWLPGERDNSYWTNYELALTYVETQLSAIDEERKDYPTYVIFLSDGLPTSYLNKNDQEVGGYESMTNPPSWLQPAGINGKEVIENLNVVLANTIDAVGEFKRDHNNIQIGTIGFAENMDDPINPGLGVAGSNVTFQYPGYHYDFILQDLATTDPANPSEKLYSQATTSQELLEALEKSVKTNSVESVLISDDLSDYVSLYTNQPDFKVTKKSANGTVTNLTVTYDAADMNYKVSEGSNEIGRLIINGKNITLDFKDDLDYKHGDTFTLSFNVEASTQAYEEYAQNAATVGNNGYGEEVGDEDTDYSNAAYTNATSSEKPGFKSNERAYASYTYKDHTYNPAYDDPVIQVGETKLEIQKVWEDGAPEGVDEVAIKIHRDNTSYTTVTLKKTDGWKTTAEHLVPKKLLATETDSSVYDHNGDALKKTTYVPFVYTLEEDFASADEDVAAILKKYGATYEYTATETADKSSFSNITSKYEGGKLVYYIPAQGSTPAGDKGKAVVTNRLVVVDITVLKVDDKGRPLDSAVFTLQKKEGTYQNIKSIKKSGDASELMYPDVTGIDSNSSFTSGTAAVTIANLPDGDYKLVEDSTKPGYIILQKEIDFTITDGEIEGTDVEGVVKFIKAGEETLALITITNPPGAALPNTGGPGTGLFVFFGSLLIAGAGWVLLRRRCGGMI